MYIVIWSNISVINGLDLARSSLLGYDVIYVLLI